MFRLATRSTHNSCVPNRYPISIPWHRIRAVVVSDGVLLPSEAFMQKLQVAIMNKKYLAVNMSDIYNGLGRPIETQIWDLLSLPSSALTMKHPPMARDVLAVRTEFERLLRNHFGERGVHWMPQVSCAIRTLQVNGILVGCRTPLSDSIIGPVRFGMRKDYCPSHIVNDGHHPSPTSVMLSKWNNGRRVETHILPDEVLHIGTTVHDKHPYMRHFVGLTAPRMDCLYRPPDVTQIELEHVFRQMGVTNVMKDFLEVVNQICIPRLT